MEAYDAPIEVIHRRRLTSSAIGYALSGHFMVTVRALEPVDILLLGPRFPLAWVIDYPALEALGHWGRRLLERACSLSAVTILLNPEPRIYRRLQREDQRYRVRLFSEPVSIVQIVDALAPHFAGLVVSAGEAADAAAPHKTPGKSGAALEPEDTTITKRQEEVLSLVSLGFSNSDIARHLNISTSSVKTHLRRLTDRTHTANRAELTAWYIRNGDGTDRRAPSPPSAAYTRPAPTLIYGPSNNLSVSRRFDAT